MSFNKKHEFANPEIVVADFAKAVSHPARVSILKILAERKECICGEIVELLPLAQATVSQHLLELKKAGLIKGEIDGPRSCYCINWKTFDQFKKSMDQFVSKLETLKADKSCC